MNINSASDLNITIQSARHYDSVRQRTEPIAISLPRAWTIVILKLLKKPNEKVENDEQRSRVKFYSSNGMVQLFSTFQFVIFYAIDFAESASANHGLVR
jgi:hypothetical protein